MLIALPSIMHSGTHILKNCILKGEHEVIYRHVLNSIKEDTEEILKKADHIISPMRHPARILASFRSRGRAFDDNEQMALVNKHYNYLAPHVFKGVMKNHLDLGETYLKQWELLKYYMSKYDINFIHIDDFDNRDENLKALSNKLGIELKKDWKVNKESGSEHNNHDIEITDDMISDIPGWIMETYERT